MPLSPVWPLISRVLPQENRTLRVSARLRGMTLIEIIMALAILVRWRSRSTKATEAKPTAIKDIRQMELILNDAYLRMRRPRHGGGRIKDRPRIRQNPDGTAIADATSR